MADDSAGLRPIILKINVPISSVKHSNAMHNIGDDTSKGTSVNARSDSVAQRMSNNSTAMDSDNNDSNIALKIASRKRSALKYRKTSTVEQLRALPRPATTGGTDVQPKPKSSWLPQNSCRLSPRQDKQPPTQIHSQIKQHKQSAAPVHSQDDESGANSATTKELSVKTSKDNDKISHRKSFFSDLLANVTNNTIAEVSGPSDVIAQSVAASFILDGKVIQHKDIISFLSDRPKPPSTPRSARLPSTHNNRPPVAREKSSRDGHTRPDPVGGRFSSPGLMAHISLEQISALQSITAKKRDKERLAQCCHLFDCMSVRYFDEEVERIKEELFRCIFENYDSVAHCNQPRSKDLFLKLEPFYVLQEKQSSQNAKLREQILAIANSKSELIEANSTLRSRLRSLPAAESTKSPPSLGDEFVSHWSRDNNASIFMTATNEPHRSLNSVGRPNSAAFQSKSLSHRQGSMIDHTHLDSAPHLGSNSSSNALLGPSSKENLLKPRPPRRASPSAKEMASESFKWINSGRPSNPIFEQAAHLVETVVAQLDDIDKFYDVVDHRNAKKQYTTKANGEVVFFKRRRGDREARWSDFVKFLDRHPEKRLQTLPALKEVYDTWRVSFGYKAEFSTMLRALKRHGQLQEGGISENGEELMIFPDSFGKVLDPSSDEEENVDFLIFERDEQIRRLRFQLQEQTSKMEKMSEDHSKDLQRRFALLEQQHREHLAFAVKSFESKLEEEITNKKMLEERIRELDVLLKAEQELNHPLDDGTRGIVRRLEHEIVVGKAQISQLHEANQSLNKDHTLNLKTIDLLNIEVARQRIALDDWKKKLQAVMERTIAEESGKHRSEIDKIQTRTAEQLGMMAETVIATARLKEHKFIDFFEHFASLEVEILERVRHEPKLELQTITAYIHHEFARVREWLSEIIDVDDDSDYIGGGHADRTTDHSSQTNIQIEFFESSETPKPKKKPRRKHGKDKKLQKPRFNTNVSLAESAERTSRLKELHGTIDSIYSEAMTHIASRDSASRQFYLHEFVVERLVKKHGEYHAVRGALEHLTESVRIFDKVDQRATIFGKLISCVDPFAHSLTEIFFQLKQLSLPLEGSTSRWNSESLPKGLPVRAELSPSTTDEGLVTREDLSVVVNWICEIYIMDPAVVLRELSSFSIFNSVHGKVFSICDVMTVVSHQLGRKAKAVGDQFVMDSEVFTYERCRDWLRQVTGMQDLNDLTLSNSYMEIARAISAGKTGSEAFEDAAMKCFALKASQSRKSTF